MNPRGLSEHLRKTEKNEKGQSRMRKNITERSWREWTVGDGVIESISLSETSTTQGLLACSENDSDAYSVLPF